jgi:hypothetical protein
LTLLNQTFILRLVGAASLGWQLNCHPIHRHPAFMLLLVFASAV